MFSVEQMKVGKY